MQVSVCDTCRLRLAEFVYLRTSKSGGEQHEERTVVFVVDAAEVAVPNQDARKSLADATGAAHAEIEAKKVPPHAANACLAQVEERCCFKEHLY